MKYRKRQCDSFYQLIELARLWRELIDHQSVNEKEIKEIDKKSKKKCSE